MTEKDLELLYLRFFYENIDLGDMAEDKKDFIKSQFRTTGLDVPERYKNEL